MRIIFLGSPEEVIVLVEQLIQLHSLKQHELVAVISQPAKPAGRKGALTDPAIASFAKQHGLKVLQPIKVSSHESLEEIRALQPDLCITAAYGQILSEDFLRIPSRGTINIHPSLLPAYRGSIPVPQALLDGIQTTGVTILFTVKQLDAGNIISQRSENIFENDNAQTLLKRLFAMGCEMLPEVLTLLSHPDFKGTPQNPQMITHCRKVSKEDGLIRWSEPAIEIVNKFKAYYPWPSVYTFSKKGRVVLTKVTLPVADGYVPIKLSPGEFIFDKKEKQIIAGTATGTLSITQLKPAGSKEIDAASFWNGLGIKNVGQFYDEEQ